MIPAAPQATFFRWAQSLRQSANHVAADPLNETDEALKAPWQRALLFVIPFGVLAFVVGWLLDAPSGQANAFDRVAYPLLALALLALQVILWRYKAALGHVVLVIVAGMSSFFLSKLFYVLFLAPATVQPQLEMTETFFWVPAIYLLAFLIPGVRWGRFSSLLYSGLTLLISLLYILSHALNGQNLGVIYALIQLNLANITLLALTFAFISFKERYTATRIRVDTMEQLAYTDLLTELPNRRWFEDQVVREVALADRHETPLAILFIDLDRFKLINDTLGHEAGDELLKQVAQRLRGCTRRSDTVARISGDEFVLLASNLVDPEDAVKIAACLQAALTSPCHINGHTVKVTASIGVCLYPRDAQDAEALLRHADSAMYKVKNSGRNGVETFTREIGSKIEALRQLERDLQGAQERGELSLHYQPQYDLRSGQLVKVEALLRWHHPRLGLISPDTFIPLAETSGLITAMGAWVLQEACRQNAAWQRSGLGEFRVAVNVSPLQFAQANFYSVVTQALAQSGLAAPWLELELTESIVIQNLETVAESLTQLKALGVGLAIDDFGTGYSSLAYLRDLPIDTLKIDRSFINDLRSPRASPQYALALIQAIISIAQNLDLEVVAEGIESKSQLELLLNLGCYLGQGYLFAKPLPAAELQNALQAHAGVVK